MRTFNRETPWGTAQQLHYHGEGVIRCSTAGHGGLWLSPERWNYLCGLFPAFNGYAPDQWLEEDMDANLACLAWPELFPAQSVFYAVRTGRNYQPSMPDERDYMASPKAWLASGAPEAAKALTIAADFATTIVGLWESGSMCSGHGVKDWSVHFTRTNDGGQTEKRFVNMAYPSKSFYSTAELDALDAAALAADARLAARVAA